MIDFDPTLFPIYDHDDAGSIVRLIQDWRWKSRRAVVEALGLRRGLKSLRILCLLLTRQRQSRA